MANGNGFKGMMDEAFESLRRQEACDSHAFSKPRKAVRTDGYGKHRRETPEYVTICKKCGRRASRPTLERLNAEVIAPAT